MKEFGLEEKLQGVTLDNTASNTTLMRELVKLLKNKNLSLADIHFEGFAHILNLGAQDFLKELKLIYDKDHEENSEIDDQDDSELETEVHIATEGLEEESPVTKLRTLFKKLKYSEKLRNKLQCCCGTVGIQMLSPSIDVKTRWNFTHDMIFKAAKMREPLTLLCEMDKDIQPLQLLQSDWDVLTAVVKYLRYFKTLSTILCGEKYVTLPLVIVGFNMLVDKLETAIESLKSQSAKNSTDIRIQSALQSALDKLMKHYSKTNWVYCAVLILDPRFKVETFYLTTWGKEMVNWQV